MIKLYDHPLSGNSYKAKLLLSHLNVDYEKEIVDLFNGEHKTADFTKLNPNQKIPVLVDGDYIIWESNAILMYLAKKYFPNEYLSDNPEEFGLITQWLIFGKTSIDPYLAVSRYFVKFLGEGNYDQKQLDSLQIQGNNTLEILNNHLSKNNFLATNYSIADIACYPYVFLSDEGGFDITKFPYVENWCRKIESQPGFIQFDNS